GIAENIISAQQIDSPNWMIEVVTVIAVNGEIDGRITKEVEHRTVFSGILLILRRSDLAWRARSAHRRLARAETVRARPCRVNRLIRHGSYRGGRTATGSCGVG